MHRDKPNYRIYALIIGEIIPEGNFLGCEIRKMTFAEQKKRKFSPIQSIFSEIRDPEYYKTYATSLPYIDPIRIKTKYVVICDINEHEPRAALGGAIRIIDRLCRFLSIVYVEDAKRKFNRERFGLLPYLYQVNKIYSLNANSDEINTDLKLESGHIYLPNRPELKKWRDKATPKFLEDIFNFHDDVLERAIKYLYRSSIGHFILDSPEKIALDHFKSIEIIVNSLSKKKEFKQRLEEAANKINLTGEEKKEILKMWDDRSSYGDVAHPSPYDQAERYPNQFPIPSNVQYPRGGFDSIAANVCLKYFTYTKSLFSIEIDEPFTYTDNSGNKKNTENTLSEVNVQWESNRLCFSTSERSKTSLKQKIKKSFAEEYKIAEADILEVKIEPGRKKVVLRIKIG